MSDASWELIPHPKSRRRTDAGRITVNRARYGLRAACALRASRLVMTGTISVVREARAGVGSIG